MFGLSMAEFGLKLLGVGRWLRDEAMAALRWALVDPWRLAFILAAACALWFYHGRDVARDASARHQAEARQWHQLFDRQKAEMIKFEGMVRTARITAARLDAANVARVKREQDVKFKETINALKSDLADANAALDDRLQHPRATARVTAGSGGGETELPIISDLPGGIVRPGEAAIVDVADARICTANTVRLEQIIAAWRKIAAINVNGADPPVLIAAPASASAPIP